MTRRIAAALGFALVLAVPPASASGQRRSTWPRPPTDRAAIEEVVITGIGIASTVLVSPVDGRVRGWAVALPQRQVSLVEKIDRLVRPMGERVPIAAAGVLWLGGATLGKEELADAGMITVEAIGATMLAKGLVQRLVGRRRPGSDPHDPADWGFARGFGDRELRSFPSGHAANAFALAAVVNEELHHLRTPVNSWVSPVLYGAATLTSLSRVMDDEHWLSDVVAGAVLGGMVSATVADLNGR